MNKWDTIRCAIQKECRRDDLSEWCEYWGFSVEDFETFLDTAVKVLKESDAE